MKTCKKVDRLFLSFNSDINKFIQPLIQRHTSTELYARGKLGRGVLILQWFNIAKKNVYIEIA